MVTEPVGYFQDIHSNVVLKFEGKWDIQEMNQNPDYRLVTQKEYDTYRKERDKETVKE